MEPNDILAGAAQEPVGPGASGLYNIEGDVTDGSVDYYDFNWGDEMEYAEWTMRSGCERARGFAGGAICPEIGTCGEEEGGTDPDDGGGGIPDPAEECETTLPAQDDQDAYEIVQL